MSVSMNLFIASCDTRKKVRSCFQDNAQSQLFRTSGKILNGLAHITDAENSAHYHRMVTVLKSVSRCTNRYSTFKLEPL